MDANSHGISYLKKDQSYLIPFFQRSYIWNQDNWEEFYDSLIDGLKQKKSPFFGSIILKLNKNTVFDKSYFSIIDGQQRLTTLSLFIKAFIDEKVIQGDVHLPIFMSLLFIYENYSSTNKLPKINHSQIDKPDYIYCLNYDGKRENINGNSNIIRAYKFFREKLNQLNDKDDIKVLREYILSEAEQYNILVVIKLNSNENEQKIFDSVNSSGVKLTSADIIKNIIFEKLIALSNNIVEPVIKFYNATWAKTFITDQETMEFWLEEIVSGRLKRQRIEVLLHSIAVIEGILDVQKDSMDELPERYQKFLDSINNSTLLEDFINKIVIYAEIYSSRFTNPGITNHFSLSNRIELFHKVLEAFDTSTFDSYILYLYYLNSVSTISDSQLEIQLLKLEKYIARTTICKSDNKKTFNKNNSDLILNLKGKSQIDLDHLLSRSDITDYEFEKGLKSITNNSISSITLFLIELKRIQNSNGRSATQSLQYIYSLEHIMPRKYEAFWSVSAFPVYDSNGKIVNDKNLAEDIRRESINELGNHTLLTQKMNSTISNSSFIDKINGITKGKRVIPGIKQYSQLSISAEIINSPQWSEIEIRKRTQSFTKEILSIW